MADKKISELDAITGADTAADDFFVVVDTSGSVTKKISRAELNNAIEQDVLAQVSITDLGSDLNTNGNDINFGDNDKAIFGAGNDLQLYHDESNSYVRDSGTGNLRLTSVNSIVLAKHNNENMLKADTDGAVTLYHNASTKLATTASGIDVTGGIDFSSGILASNGSVQFVMDKDNNGGEVFVWGHNASNATTNELMRLTSAGSLGIGTAPNASSKLHVSGGRSYFASNSNAFATYLRYNDTTAGVFVGSPAANEFQVSASSGAARFKIDSDGRVGIGTTTPSSYGELAVYKASGNVEAAVVTGGANYATYRLQNNAQRYSMQIRTDQSNAFVIRDETAGANRFVVSTAGTVGIGTAPAGSVQLDVRGTGVLQLVNTDTVQLLASNGGSTLKNVSNNPLIFGTNNTERMRFTSFGDVGIGRSDPQNIVGNSGGGLVVKSGASRAGTTSLFAVQDSSGNNSFLQLHNGQTTFSTGAAGSKVEAFKIADGGFITHTRASGAAQSMIGFKNGANFVGEIRTSTTATAYITSSDYRLKENVTAITSATNRLNQLNPVRFNFIADADTTVDGFIAHEVATVIPEAISGEKDEVDADGNAVMQGIDQSKLVPLLTAALQEALTKIDQLETRITALEA